MTFTCGCQPPTYCPTHADWACHFFSADWAAVALQKPYCPPCQQHVWRSVTLDARATPTRNRSDV